MKLNKLIKVARPLAIIVLGVIGYLQDIVFTSDVSNYIFLAIIGVSLLLDSKGIIDSVTRMIGGELPPTDDEFKRRDIGGELSPTDDE